ncbi:MAG: peptide chain release factor N(5)-glutamine methyltransferase [Proteobacteria bacterium]|nr:peptide chain release factor N(5)-glutamine methyltransferase [Pseudomonadota bacterium]
MKISDILAQARIQLEKSGVSSSKLDSLILLAHALSFSKEQVIFNPDFNLDQNQQDKFFSLINRRTKREPVSQIIGKREFYGRDFLVTSRVLDPRPDSEILIELVIKKLSPQIFSQINILELGSGSGCLIITLLILYKKAQAFAVDISSDALEICKRNSAFHQVYERLQTIKSDLFAALDPDKKFDLIISNPPYIKSQDILNLEDEVKKFEPHLALDGGADGLDFYRRIAQEAFSFLQANGYLIVEIGFDQKEKVIKIFSDKKLTFIESKPDLSGIQRALCFQKIN